MSIHTDTKRYEDWLRKRCNVDEAALEQKHKRMRKNEFVFLRATYYRWARKIGEWCPELRDAPHVLAIGDLHTENYGTWRDGEGRLVWGVNDFDEAASMPYVLDLVRLATSAALAPRPLLSPGEACASILDGYRKGLDNPRPMLLEEHGAWMRPRVVCSGHECEAFWQKVAKYPRDEPPAHVAARLRRSLPKRATVSRFCTRMVGGGALVGRVILFWRNGAAGMFFTKPRRLFHRRGTGRATGTPRVPPLSNWRGAVTAPLIPSSIPRESSFTGASRPIHERSNSAIARAGT